MTEQPRSEQSPEADAPDGNTIDGTRPGDGTGARSTDPGSTTAPGSTSSPGSTDTASATGPGEVADSRADDSRTGSDGPDLTDEG